MTDTELEGLAKIACPVAVLPGQLVLLRTGLYTAATCLCGRFEPRSASEEI